MIVGNEDVTGKFLERAAVEQTAARLEAEGFKVEREKSLGPLRVDLVAKRDDETSFYEFKMAGADQYDGWADRLLQLQRMASKSGASLKLVMVRPPRKMTIDIDGIDEILLAYLAEHIPSEVADIAGHTQIDEIGGVDVTSIAVIGTIAEVAGQASLGVTLLTGGGEFVSSEYFPFSFTATIDLATSIAEAVLASDFDLSSWFGDQDDEASQSEDDQGQDGDESTPF
jgi:Holliday junction resolvase